MDQIEHFMTEEQSECEPKQPPYHEHDFVASYW